MAPSQTETGQVTGTKDKIRGSRLRGRLSLVTY
jgi:hypothetical protein